MSLIVYKNNTLYADDSGIVNTIDDAYYKKSKKLFKRAKTAIAFVGSEVDEESEEFKKYFDEIEKHLENKDIQSFVVTYDLQLSNPCIVITSSSVYSSIDGLSFQKLQNDIIITEGLEKHVALICLTTCNMSVIETFNFIKDTTNPSHFTNIEQVLQFDLC